MLYFRIVVSKERNIKRKWLEVLSSLRCVNLDNLQYLTWKEGK